LPPRAISKRWVNALAAKNGLLLAGDRAMPANNRSIWWIKT
jgi:hypothetical protein